MLCAPLRSRPPVKCQPAADELHVTHGAVGRQIRALEAQLGVVLFVKDGRGVKLTEAGLRLRDVAFDAFERIREVYRAAASDP